MMNASDSDSDSDSDQICVETQRFAEEKEKRKLTDISERCEKQESAMAEDEKERRQWRRRREDFCGEWKQQIRLVGFAFAFAFSLLFTTSVGHFVF